MHEHYVSTSGLSFCFQNNLSPAVVPKSIGRWGTSRYVWDHMLRAGLLDSAESLTRIFTLHSLQKKAKKREKPSEKSPFAKIDTGAIIHDRAGFTEEETRSPTALFKKIKKVSKSLDPTRASEFLAKIMVIKAYDEALLAHSPTGRSANKKSRDKSLPTIPSLEDLDRWVEAHGIGFTRWMGDGDFFGWDGSPDSLGLITPKNTSELDDAGTVYRCPLPPVGLHIVGWEEEEENEDRSHIVCLLSAFEDEMQRNYREMNWSASEEQFQKLPHRSAKTRLEDNLWSTSRHASQEVNAGKQWIGSSDKVRYLLQEGTRPDLHLFGGIILANDFQDAADAIGAHTKTYKAGFLHADQFWINSIASLATRMIASYGITGASIVEALMPGYLLVPSALQMDITTGEDEVAAIQKMRKTPFVLEPIISKESIRKLNEDSDYTEAFVNIIQHTHLPHLSKEEVEEEVYSVIFKVEAAMARGVNDNFMDRCSEMIWDDTEGKSAPQQKFSDGLDEFVRESAVDWISSHDSIEEEQTRLEEWED